MRKTLGCIAGSVLMVLTLNGGEAVAGRTSTVGDNPNDARAGIDMRGVTAERLSGGRIQVRVAMSDFGPRLNAVEAYFDTNRGRRGPEYFARVLRNKDGDGISGVRMYRYGGGELRQRISCAWRYRWQYRGGRGYFNTTFGPVCFQRDSANGVRVRANTWDYTRYRTIRGVKQPTFGYYDLLARSRTYTRIV